MRKLLSRTRKLSDKFGQASGPSTPPADRPFLNPEGGSALGTPTARNSSLTPQVNISISNSHFTAGRDNNIIVEVNRETETKLQRLKVILSPVDAAWDSYASDQRSKCFENTRVQLLGDIGAWISGSSNQTPIFVLDGVAGIGKSTVAQTIAELASELGVLGASFFFTRNEEERATARHFFPTIAFQLARYRVDFARKIAEAIEKDPDAAQKIISQQLRLLVFSPLKDLLTQKEAPILIVIDALDECKEEEARSLLTLLAQYIPLMPQLKVFITTRPESHIRDILARDGNHQLFRLHEIEDFIVQSDIRFYLGVSLSAEHVRAIFPHRQPPWQPSSHDMNMLCGMCGTLFITASTATKFILDKKAQNPERRLARLLEGVSPADFSGSKYTDVMDKFYIQIIRSAVPHFPDEVDEWLNLYQLIIGAIITLRNPLPARALATLLGIDVTDIESTLLHLHSLVAPSGSETIYRLHHKSFPDFVTSEERIQVALDKLTTNASNLAPKFLIDTNVHHQQMAKVCFRVMDQSLKQNVADLSPDEYFLDVADVASLRCRPLRADLVYAASHWASHIHTAGVCDVEIQEMLSKWALTHMMAWLEVMSIIGHVNRAHSMLSIALDAIGANTEYWQGKSVLHAHLSDARRFLLQSSEVVKLAPMHIYWSALGFIPQNSHLHWTYGEAQRVRVCSGLAREWDPSALVTMTEHAGMVYAVAFSPNKGTLASASLDGTVCLWDGTTGTHISTLEGHSHDVRSLAFSPDGLRLATASNDRTIRLWDATTGVLLTTKEGHSDWINSVSFSPDGSTIASGSDDKSIRIWDGITGAHLTTLYGHRDPVSVTSVTFSPDGSVLASAGYDSPIHLWDLTVAVPKATVILESHSHVVRDIAFSPNGLRLAAASTDNTIHLLEAPAGSHAAVLRGHSDDVNSVQFSPDGARLASASRDCTVRLWDAWTGAPVTVFKAHSLPVRGVAFSPDSFRLATGSEDATVRLWDVSLDNRDNPSRDTKLSSESASMAHVSSADIIPSHDEEVTAVTYSPDGSKFVSGSRDSTLQFWDGKTGAHIRTNLYGRFRRSYRVNAIAFSPDGSKVASSSEFSTIELCHGNEGDRICTLSGHEALVVAILFSPDGSILASGSEDKTIRFWDGNTGAHIRTLLGHSSRVLALAFSLDGSKLVSTSYDRTFRVWDGRSGSYIRTFNSSEPTHSIAFSPGGSTLASVSADTLYLRTPTRSVHAISLGKHFDSIRSFVFLPSTPQHPYSPVVGTVHHVTDPISTRPIAIEHSWHIVALGMRKTPSLAGLVYVKIQAGEEPIIAPICWFPPHLIVTSFTIDPTRASMVIGCKDGRVLLLDISNVSLP